ncbi:Sterol 3-beta-glucosyltransferase [Hondaea fermentalgiana]|uniref:Sterol 3-beta-glucosyltransferase n=1 Tax=Hondaea fermentalgiana TaxID=2315210 RepID=A0A2R5G8K8_9STRA|nr:Sterol 3-beta-glucosyltransferase [Hondaea fermentalgiana]|eukprot:GBG26659.1 Sterol 3-beta-glucosyltransferase [Hondaea fermentalgiana]
MEGFGVQFATLGVLGAGLIAVALGALFDSINKKPDVAQSGAAEFVQKRNGEIRKVIILALGTRGDVEPCLALAAAAPRGVSALVCGPGDFAPLAKRYGVMFRSCGVDRLEPTRAWAEAKTMRDFILHAAEPYSTKFAPIASAYWQACREHESEMIIASTFAVHFGVHMAEALACPFWALKFAPETPSGQMPPFGEASWTRWPWNTSIVTKGRHWARLLAAFQATQAVDFSGKQNKFRNEVLELPDMTLEILDRLGSKLKTLYAYSSIVAPRPTDWPAWTTARALKCGRPSLLIPALQFYDQVGWAKALDVGGAGIHLQAEHADETSIQEALSRLLDPTNGFEGKADAMRRDISQEDALERAWSLLRASS